MPRIENDMLVELIVRALPDMSLNELSELENAVNAEIQDRHFENLDEYGDISYGGTDSDDGD